MSDKKVDKGGSFNTNPSLESRSWTMIDHRTRATGFRIKLKLK